MAKELPIKTTIKASPCLSVVDEPATIGDAQVLDITNFKEEMQDCIELDEELERYFKFLSKLSREELLAIVKYEVYNRVLMQQDLDLIWRKTDE